MAIKSHARKDVTKKLLSLCVGIALLSGTGGVLADAADQTVAGNLDGTAVTGNTTFNTVTVKSNTEAVVKNKDGQETTITNSSGGGWKLVAGAQDTKISEYEPVAGNVVNVSSNETITIEKIYGGNSHMDDGVHATLGYNVNMYLSTMNNVVNIGENGSMGTLKTHEIDGGHAGNDDGQDGFFPKASPFFNVLNFNGMTVTSISSDQSDRVKIYGGSSIGGKCNAYNNIINIQGTTVLQQADVYAGDTKGRNTVGYDAWGGNVSGNHVNLSGKADLGKADLHEQEDYDKRVRLNGFASEGRLENSRTNVNAVLNIGYQENCTPSSFMQLPGKDFFTWQYNKQENGENKIGNGSALPDNDQYYLSKPQGKVVRWENNEVYQIQDFSSIKIWAMKDDYRTPALKVSALTGTDRRNGTTIFDLSYLTSGKDLGVISEGTEMQEIDLRDSSVHKEGIFFANAKPSAIIPVIQIEKLYDPNRDYRNNPTPIIKANQLIYGYVLPEVKKQDNRYVFTGSYTGDAVYDNIGFDDMLSDGSFTKDNGNEEKNNNDVVWKTTDITVESISLPDMELKADESQRSAITLEKYGYLFNAQTKFSLENMKLVVSEDRTTLLASDEKWNLIDGSQALRVAGMENLENKGMPVSYDLNGGALTVSTTGTTAVSTTPSTDNNEQKQSLRYQLDNPGVLRYHRLDWSKTAPVASLKAGSNYDLSQTKVDLTHMQVEGIASLPSGSSQRTLLSVNGEQTGLSGANITGGEERTLERKGTTTELIGKADIAENGDLVYALSRRIQPQTHNVILGQEAGLAALIDDNDLVLDTMKNLDKAEKGLQTFATVGGGENRYKAGSHITTNVWRGQAGAAWKRQKNGVEQELGIFYEYGDGSYRTYAENHGGGKLSYKGAGVLFKRTEADGRYGEVSLRVGRASNDARNLLHDGVGNTIAYKANGMYHAFQAGLGRITQRGRGNSFDTYLRYFHTHLNGDSFEAGGRYDVDGLESHILRIGSRWQHQDRNWEYYAGLAYQYEFSGNAYGLAEGNIIESASLRGGSVRLEYGMRLETNRWRVALNASDYAGQHKGYNGNISVTYKF